MKSSREVDAAASGGLNRRRMLQGAAGATAAVLGVAGSETASAQAAEGSSRARRTSKIDVHAHYLPADYRQALIDYGHSQPDGFPVLPTWSAQSHLAMMDRVGIGTSMLSITSPGVSFGGDPVEWARRVNDSGASTVRDHPDRFGLFASLPLPDVDAALAECVYAFDTLNADGIAVETNFDGIYLGDSRFEPVFAELNRRRAVMFIHPTSPACFEETSLGYPRPMVEYLVDTTRAVSNMVLNGTLAKYPDIRVIVPHCGSAIPAIADRIAALAAGVPLGGQAAGAIDVIGTLQRLYYEVGAGYPFPRQFESLLTLVDPGQMLFGSDFPYGAIPVIESNVDSLLKSHLIKAREVEGILRDNALALLPRLAAPRKG